MGQTVCKPELLVYFWHYNILASLQFDKNNNSNNKKNLIKPRKLHPERKVSRSWLSKYPSKVYTCSRKWNTPSKALHFTDLPVSLCTPRGDVEQEKKSADKGKRLHVVTERSFCFPRGWIWLLGVQTVPPGGLRSLKSVDRNGSYTKHGGFHVFPEHKVNVSSQEGGEKKSLSLSSTVHLQSHNITQTSSSLIFLRWVDTELKLHVKG